MQLTTYLQRAGHVTGPLSKNTSYSGLETLLRFILGKPPMQYGAPQNYGIAVHEQYLEKKKRVKVTPEEQRQIDKAIIALNNNPIVKRLMKKAVTESKKYKKLKGVELAYILDINEQESKVGADIKTTVITNLAQFVAKAEEYGYFRQAKIYILVEGLKMFFIVAVTKEKNPRVYLFCVSDYPKQLAKAEKELNFLLYFYKVYGKPTEQYYAQQTTSEGAHKSNSFPPQEKKAVKKAALPKKRKAH